MFNKMNFTKYESMGWKKIIGTIERFGKITSIRLWPKLQRYISTKLRSYYPWIHFIIILYIFLVYVLFNISCALQLWHGSQNVYKITKKMTSEIIGP